MKTGILRAMAALAMGLPAAAGATEAAIERDRLALAFEQPMVTWGDEVHPALGLEPAVPVDRCYWYDDTELSCEFADGHHARYATRYFVHVPAFDTQDGSVVQAQTLQAETPRPLLTVPAYAVEWRGGLPRIHIHANQEVSANAVAGALELTVDGRPVAVGLAPGEERDWIPSAFILDLPQAGGPWRGMLQLAVVPGLVGEEGPLPGIQQAVLLRARLGEAPRARRLACGGGGAMAVDVSAETGATITCPPGAVFVEFNRSFDEASRAGFERQLPVGVELVRWSGAGQRYFRSRGGQEVIEPPGEGVQLRIADPRTRVRIDVVEGLRTVEGRAFAGSTLWIETEDHPPALRAPSASLLLLDPAAPLPVAAVNAPPGRTLRVDALGRRSASATTRLPVGPLNVDMGLDERRTRRALRDGGWARWTLPATGSDWAHRAQSLHLAAPQFDMVAIASADEVLVWLNGWDTGRPVSDATVELMRHSVDAEADFEAVTIATATSASDGVARLRLPAGYLLERDALGRNEWFVRADAGERRDVRRAVLPLGAAGRLALANPGSQRAWGVTDRPLYRAGDTVKFRLWQRADRAGRLVGPHVSDVPDTLHLKSLDEYKFIRSWPATPLGGDGWVGEVVLPVHANDGTYCITPFDERHRDEEGACFFVGTYRAQDLWVQASAPETVLREGERFRVELAGGYYSGGPAAGVGIGNVTTMLTGLPLSQAYPEFAAFTFVDVLGPHARGGISVRPFAVPERTDAEGRVAIEVPVDFDTESIAPEQLPAFGRFQVAAELALDSREATASNAAGARFARHDAFVGLRVEPRWLDAQTPVRAEAVVIDAEGLAVPGRVVDVEIDFLAGFRGEAEALHVGRCQLRSDGLEACDFPRARSGRYRLTARSGDAAPAELVQYVWHGDQAGTIPVAPVLEVVELPGAPGEHVQVVLRQAPRDRAVLFVVSHRGRIVSHAHAQTTSTAGVFDLPLPVGLVGEVEVTAYLRDAPGAPPEGVLRTPVAVATAETTFLVPAADRTPVEIAFAQPQVEPGGRTWLTVRNLSSEPRNITISVMGDALRALAADFLDYSDPHGPYWLGQPTWRGGSRRPALRGFSDWGSGSRWEAWLAPPQEEPPVVFGTSPAPPSAPAPPASMSYGEEEASQLDRIQVTGSRITLADVFSPGKGRMDVPSERAGAGAEGLIARMARVRGAFSDTALWVGDMRLAAGEQRRIELTLPDDLTRWRAIAWSANADDDFDMAEATVESGLPVETRLQVPVRMYPGDRARLVGNARQVADSASTMELALQASGAGTDEEFARSVDVPARGQVPFPLEIAPLVPGTVEAIAAARTRAGSDGVGARIEVATVMVQGHRVQAGLLPGKGVALDLPELPAGATDPHLQVDLLRGGAGLVQGWTRDLREFRHRCWEQMLSRAVGAALALTRGDDAWPDASAAIEEALDNASVFQDQDGAFHFFADTLGAGWRGMDARGNIALTAYSLRALELLADLGHEVPERVVDSAHAFLAQSLRSAGSQANLVDTAFASEAVADAGAERELAWQHWNDLNLPARIAVARGMARNEDPHAQQAYRLLLEHAPRRGLRRVVTASGDWSRWMGSTMREQCALIDLLGGVPQLQAERGELIAGLTDLFAGGIESTDTQSSAICLMALRDLAGTQGEAIEAELRAGSHSARLRIEPGSDRARWDGAAGDLGSLRLSPVRPAGASSYVAELRYQEDARQAQPSAIGLGIARRYHVLRDGAWAPVDEDVLRESDWVRVTLEVSTPAVRHFVALTDSVPGGLQPTDLRLSGIGGLDLQSLSDTGSVWFSTRRLDARSPKFYAERLPPGRHEVHYFARVGNAGDFLAAPATAELMYGNASRARSAAQRLLIDVDRNATQP